MERERGFATRAIHDSELPPAVGEQPVAPPIWPTSDYLYESHEHYADVMNERRAGYVYGRYGNPTHTALHGVLASIEGADAAWSFASGMAALHTTLTSLVSAGDHLVAQRALYGGTFSLLTRGLPRYGVEVTLVDPEADAVAEAIRPNTRAVLIETLANPTFRVADVRGIAGVCGEREIALVVDNTVPSPYLLRPLGIEGVTLVVHSTSKYIAGHSWTIGGAVAGPGSLVDGIRRLAIEQGTTAGAFEAWLTLMGVQTLELRMQRQCATAWRLADALDGHPKVASVGYAGLPRHPDHRRAQQLFGGEEYGAMLSAELAGGPEAVSAMGEALKVARVGSSFGGMRTEVCHPATTSHRQLSDSDREAAGIGDGLIRIAVGGEEPGDLVDDLLQALDKV